MIATEITEWWDFKRRLKEYAFIEGQSGWEGGEVVVHITTRLSMEDILHYRIANILSFIEDDTIVYTVIGSLFDLRKLKEEVEKLKLPVRGEGQPMDYAYAYGKHLRHAILREIAKMNEDKDLATIKVVNGFYGKPDWIKELLRWV